MKILYSLAIGEFIFLAIIFFKTYAWKELWASIGKKTLILKDEGNTYSIESIKIEKSIGIDSRNHSAYIIPPGTAKPCPKLKTSIALITTPSAIGYDVPFAVTSLKAWQEQASSIDQMMYEPVFDDKGNPVKDKNGNVIIQRKETIQLDNTKIGELSLDGFAVPTEKVFLYHQRHDEQGLWSRIQKEATLVARRLLRSQGTRSLIWTFVMVLLAVAIGYYLISSGSFGNITEQIGSAVSNAMARNQTIAENATRLAG
jgi:hypothetical protein